MDLDDLENAVARLDAVAARHPAALSMDDQAERVLGAIIARYATGDEPVRAGLRRLLDRHQSFRWAARLPDAWDGVEAFRARLIHLSVRDQSTDTRDEILVLLDLCKRATSAGIDVNPVLDEVAAMSSQVNRYGMGSMRHILLSYGKTATGRDGRR